MGVSGSQSLISEYMARFFTTVFNPLGQMAEDLVTKKRQAQNFDGDAEEERPAKYRKVEPSSGTGAPLTPEIQKYARFADSAYKETRAEKLSVVNDPQWRLDNMFKKNSRVDVWVNDESKEVIMSNRGTDDLQDIGTDIRLALGLSSTSKRFQESARHYEKIGEKYDSDEYKHILVGHSLGGSVNNHIYHNNEDSVSSVHNFNPGSSIESVLAKIKHKVTKADHSKVHQYTIKGDDISVMGRGNSSYTNHEIEMREGTLNPHSIHQFLS